MLLLKPHLSRKPSGLASPATLRYLHPREVGRGQAGLLLASSPPTSLQRSRSEGDEAGLLGRLRCSALLLRAHLPWGRTLTPPRGCFHRKAARCGGEELQRRSCAPPFAKSPPPRGRFQKAPSSAGIPPGEASVPTATRCPSWDCAFGQKKPPPKLVSPEVSAQGKGTLASPVAQILPGSCPEPIHTSLTWAQLDWFCWGCSRGRKEDQASLHERSAPPGLFSLSTAAGGGAELWLWYVTKHQPPPPAWGRTRSPRFTRCQWVTGTVLGGERRSPRGSCWEETGEASGAERPHVTLIAWTGAGASL